LYSFINAYHSLLHIDIDILYISIVFIAYIIGFIIKLCFFPEKYYKGCKCTSHNIWHVFVLFDMILTFFIYIDIYNYRIIHECWIYINI
jgi:predicted membrane channel-forming protein YqfA (hemolysin III family)